MIGARAARYRTWLTVLVALTIAGTALGLDVRFARATDGAITCDLFSGGQAGELASSSGFIIGARASIEGQPLTLCGQTTPAQASGSFHWAAVEIDDGLYDGYDIFQVGYGRCLNTDNLSQWGATNCSGSMYLYWAWGSYCSGDVNGSGGVYGPIPLRIGSVITTPPSSTDFYVLRETIGGISYYDGYVNGTLLSGTDALGHTMTARVPAADFCWNTRSTNRYMTWFGETFNDGDSMGGWDSSGSRNHLDYTSLKFSINTGWVSPSNLGSGECNGDSDPVYVCTIVSNSHIYVDTQSR
jgi:hypothetical protein